MIIRVVILAGLLFAGVRFYIWHSAKREVDQVIAHMAPLITIGYMNLQVGFDGNVTLKGLRVGSLLFKDTIRADSLTIHTGDIWSMLGEFQGVGENKPFPQLFSIDLTRAQIDLGSDYMRALDESGFDVVSAPWDRAGCGDVDHFGAQVLRDLGYNTLTVNARVEYRFSRFNHLLTLAGKLDIADLSSSEFEQSYAVEMPAISMRELHNLEPTLSELKWRYHDDSFVERRNTFCAAKLGIPVEQFIDRHVQAVADAAAQEGLRLGDRLLHAYRGYVTHPKVLRLTAQPAQPVDLGKVAHYRLDALLEWLNVRVAINDEEIDPVQFKVAAPKVDPGATGDSAADGQAPKRAPAVVVWTRGGSLDALLPHLGKDVLVLTKDGRTLAGVLLTVTEAGLEVQRHVHGGTAILPVRRQSVEAARVLSGDEVSLDWDQRG